MKKGILNKQEMIKKLEDWDYPIYQIINYIGVEHKTRFHRGMLGSMLEEELNKIYRFAYVPEAFRDLEDNDFGSSPNILYPWDNRIIKIGE